MCGPTGDPEAVAGTVRREVQTLDRNLLLQVESLETSIRELLWAQRLSAGVLAVFGAAGVYCWPPSESTA